MMPVLGILLSSPQELEMKYGRHIASDEPAPQAEVARAESKTPKLDQLLTNVEIPVRPNPLNLNSDMLKEDVSKLLSRVSKAEEFDKNTVEKPALDHLRDEIKVSAIELRQVENSIKDLMNPDDEGDIRSRIDEAKIHLEASLKDLSDTEALVAARGPRPVADAPAPVVASNPPQETSVRAPSVVPEETRVEPAPSTASASPASTPAPVDPSKDPILCALQDQNKLLTQTLQTLMTQQQQIMGQMMQMMQMSMYRTPDTFNYQQMYPSTSGTQGQGAWVYLPNGMQSFMGQQQQPQQQQFQYNPYPMMGGYGMAMNGMQPQGMQPQGMYGMQTPGTFGMQSQVPQMQPPMLQQPDMMMNQGGGQWGLAPQATFPQPQITHNPGNFGMGSSGLI